jgi:hypothetical protein
MEPAFKARLRPRTFNLPSVLSALLLAGAGTSLSGCLTSSGVDGQAISPERAIVNRRAEKDPSLLKPGEFSAELHLVLLLKKNVPEVRDGRSLWAIQAPISYRTQAGDLIRLPKGMVTDLASIPRELSPFLPPDGPWVQAACFHDMLYETKGTGVWYGHPSNSREKPYTREEADGILREAMTALNISEPQKTIIWLGVRVGGAGGWGH